MKKGKKIFLFALLTCAFTFAVKTESKAAQITGLKQTDASSGSIEIQWNADLAAYKYSVDISSDKKTWVNGKDTSYSTEGYISGLTAGSTYYVRVTGYNDDGVATSQTSNPLEVVTAPSASVTAVQIGATTTGAKIRYNNVAGANYYYVTAENDYVLGTSTTTTVTTTRRLTPATQYWVRCRAARRASTGFIAVGSWSYDYIDIKTVSNKINTKNFGVTNVWANINSYNFGVSSQGNVDGYQFQFLTMKGKVKKTVTTTSSSVSVDKFINGTFYKYRVRSYVDCGSTKAYSVWSSYRYIGMPKSFKAVASKKTIKCSWSKLNSASSYAVYISTKEKAGYKKVKTLSAKKRSINITKYGKKKLKKGKRYYVKVIAKSKSGKKTVSSDVCWISNGRLY